jgi:hypothetical protein
VLEVTLAMTVLLVGLLAATASTLRMHAHRRVNRERMLAENGVRAVVERLHSVSMRAADDPAGWSTVVETAVAAGGEVGTAFDVRELTPREGADAVGTIELVDDETATDAALGVQLGMPRDLDGDGAATSDDVGGRALLLPVIVRARWTGSAGNGEIRHVAYLSRF